MPSLFCVGRPLSLSLSLPLPLPLPLPIPPSPCSKDKAGKALASSQSKKHPLLLCEPQMRIVSWRSAVIGRAAVECQPATLPIRPSAERRESSSVHSSAPHAFAAFLKMLPCCKGAAFAPCPMPPCPALLFVSPSRLRLLVSHSAATHTRVCVCVRSPLPSPVQSSPVQSGPCSKSIHP